MNLTIGVCAYNEERKIKTLLGDILDQKDLPQGARVVVVASGCTDNTVSIVRDIANSNPKVELIEEKNRAGKTNAINIILANCLVELLVLVSADIRLPKDSIGEILEAISDERVAVVGGLPVVENSENGTVAKSAAIIWRVMRQTMTELGSTGELPFVMGELYCFRTSLLERIPSQVVNDDAYIATLARDKGLKVVHAANANFVLKVPSSIPDYIAQRRRVTYGHLLIKTQMGRFANVEGIALDHTLILARAMIREATSHPMSVVRAMFLLELEVVVRLLAWLDLREGRQHATWSRIASTK
ncbi:MAG: glycosyltransferase [Candidatus Bathyarchaeia archaeon]|jgi:cellulose synthase/poly-beta-1,6-N-acetylglucosamine synthase-like glycosyltransferase